MDFLCNLSIRNKLSGIILLSSLLLIIVISAGLIGNEKISLRQNLRADLLILADIAGANASVGLVFGDIQAATDTLASLQAKTIVTQAWLFDADGRGFAHYARDAAAQRDVATSPVYLADVYSEAEKALLPERMTEKAFFSDDYAVVLKPVTLRGSVIGVVYIQAELSEMRQRLTHYLYRVALISLLALALSLLLARYLQRIITQPVFELMGTMDRVATDNNYQLRAREYGKDELGRLIRGFNTMLATIAERDQEIHSLNSQLKQENRRMSAELDITRRLQTMLLPKECELKQIEDLDIACFMRPADEVGGDYYDVLYRNGQVKIGIGDVTGHGLESGMVMLMVQMAVRTLLTSQVSDAKTFLKVLNEALFDNVKRMDSDKNLTLSLLDYQNGQVRISGQHEEILKVSRDGKVERIDTLDLGFMVGLTQDISAFIGEITLPLETGEGIVLYTDGVTEAHNEAEEMYGLERLCASIKQHWELANSKQIQTRVLDDFHRFVGNAYLNDDVTLVVLRRKD